MGKTFIEMIKNVRFSYHMITNEANSKTN